MTTPLSAFFPLVAPMVPGAPDLAVESAALYGAINFCQRTLALQRDLAPIASVVGQGEYIVTSGEEVIERLFGVRIDGRSLTLMTPAEIDRMDSADTASEPYGALLWSSTTVRLFPKPMAAGRAVAIRAAMRPTLSAQSVDDDLFERYGMAIADGAASWMLSQQGAPYYNPQAAQAAQMRFIDACAAAKAATYVGNARTSARGSIHWC